MNIKLLRDVVDAYVTTNHEVLEEDYVKELQRLYTSLNTIISKTEQLCTEDVIPMTEHMHETLNEILDTNKLALHEQCFVITVNGKTFVIDLNADSWDSMMSLLSTEKSYWGL
jgi:hypothetical protein